MASETTRYKVDVLYDVTDRASKSLKDIARSADLAARASGGLKSALMGIGGAVLGSRAIGAAKSALLDFNSSIEDSKIVIAGMLQMNVGGVFEKHMERATKSVARFQQMAAKSALTTKDLVDMAQMIARPLLQAGASMKDVEELSFGAANAAMAFGMNPSVAAFDVEQALSGTLTKRDRFMNNLLRQKGIGLETKTFNKLNPQKRLEAVMKALKSEPIQKMALAQSQTLKGVTSTLKDNLEMAAGRVGLPLFKAITKEVMSWNDWMEKNSDKVDKFVKQLSEGLVDGFKMVKSAVGFLVDHASTIMAIGKVWAAVKIGGFVGNALGGSLSNIAGMASAGGSKIKGVGGIAGALGPAAMAFGGGYGIGSLINEHVVGGASLRHTWVGDLVRSVTGVGEAFESLEKRTEQLNARMTQMDEGVERAKKEGKKIGGFAGSNTWAFTQARINELMEEQNRSGDTLRARRRFNQGHRGFAQFLVGGITPEQAGGGRGAEIARLIGKQTGDMANAQTFFALAAAKMKAAELKSLDIDAAQAGVLEMVRHRAYAAEQLSKGFTATAQGIEDFTNAIIMLTNPVHAAEKILKANVGPSAKPAQTNVHIAKVEVPAKDPDRWIADLDAKIAKRVRAPREPKKGTGKKGGL